MIDKSDCNILLPLTRGWVIDKSDCKKTNGMNVSRLKKIRSCRRAPVFTYKKVSGLENKSSGLWLFSPVRIHPKC